MTITWEAVAALAAVIIFGIEAFWHRSLLALGLAFLALAFMLGAGIRVG